MDKKVEPCFVPARESDVLQPILIAGYGRSGTTAVMKILATDPQVAFDREYPYEIRYLSYYAKLSSILENRVPDERFTSDHLYTFDESVFGPWPWVGHNGGKDVDWLRIFWELFSCNEKRANPMVRFYAEKAPAWLMSMVRQTLPCSTIHLFRDPRDVYLSANAFMKMRNYYSFHRTPADTDLDHARSLGLGFVSYFENFFEDRSQNTDSFFLRYEDLALHPEEFTAWLRRAGLRPELDHAFDQIEGHQTSPALVLSVRRWQREYIPPEVLRFFERQLGREMKALGYSVDTAEFCPSIEFRTGQPVPQLSNPADGRIEVNENATTVYITGRDFGILVPFEPIQAEEVKEVWVSAAGNVGDHFSIYWRDVDSDFSEERGIHVNYVPGSHWTVVRFRMCQHPLWKGMIQQIRVDLFNSRLPETQGVGQVRWVRLVC